VEDVSSSSLESIYRSLYFTPPNNIPLTSFKIVRSVLIVSSVPWSLSMSFEFKQWGTVSCVFESAWYCRDAFEDRHALMRCLKPKLHRCMISECEYSSCFAYYRTRHHFHHNSNHHLCNRRTYKEEINQCP
jgi:hypothetical protein